ncbi:MAG: DUF1993 domain-containing protein [Sphingobium sp.]
MTISLYEATVPSFVQIITSLKALTKKAEAFCAEKEMDEAELLNSHLGTDMRPLSWQIKWTSSHSIGAIEGVRRGLFVPDRDPPAGSFADLRDQLESTLSSLNSQTPEAIDGFVGKDMKFAIPGTDTEMDFTAENFLLSFSLPNFYFHATTAYDLLRHAGIEIGKRDFIGRPRIKTSA